MAKLVWRLLQVPRTTSRTKCLQNCQTTCKMLKEEESRSKATKLPSVTTLINDYKITIDPQHLLVSVILKEMHQTDSFRHSIHLQSIRLIDH